jgi:hypothetical protein
MTPTMERSQYLMYPPFEGVATRCASDLFILLRRQVKLLELLGGCGVKRTSIHCKVCAELAEPERQVAVTVAVALALLVTSSPVSEWMSISSSTKSRLRHMSDPP